MRNVIEYRSPVGRYGMLAALAGALLAGTCAHAADVTYERLVNPEPQNWLSVHHDYTAQRFSALDGINRTNVNRTNTLACSEALLNSRGTASTTAFQDGSHLYR